MTAKPVTFQESDVLQEAMRILLQRRISGAPVVNAAGNLVGVLSESDVLWKEAGMPDDEWIIPPLLLPILDQVVAWRDNAKFADEVRKVLARTVGESMTKGASLVTVAPSATLQDAAKLMLRRKVNRLPVVDGTGRLVGILTRSDVVKALADSPGNSMPPV